MPTIQSRIYRPEVGKAMGIVRVSQPPIIHFNHETLLSIPGNPSPNRGNLPVSPASDLYTLRFNPDRPTFIRALPDIPSLISNSAGQASASASKASSSASSNTNLLNGVSQAISGSNASTLGANTNKKVGLPLIANRNLANVQDDPQGVWNRVQSISSNQATTSSIQQGAVSDGSSNSFPTQTDIHTAAYLTWYTLATVSVTTSGGVVFLSPAGSFTNAPLNPSSATVWVQVYKGANAIGPQISVVVGSTGATGSVTPNTVVIDMAPGTGTNTYYLKCNLQTNTGTYSFYANTDNQLSSVYLKV